MAIRLDVRRLAAVDMWGSAGVRWRRWVILIEFLVGVFGGGALGIGLLVSDGDVPSRLLGVWLVGVALNYVPLSLHALTLIRPGALEAELAGVDVHQELRHYTTAQFWIAVPLLLMVLAARRKLL
jgi:hypothetical protein